MRASILLPSVFMSLFAVAANALWLEAPNSDKMGDTYAAVPERYIITGRVLDSKSGQGIPQAGITVADSTGRVLFPFVTEDDGSFRISCAKTGAYNIRIVVFGDSPRQYQAIVSDEEPMVDLGAIYLKGTLEIEEVVVVSRRGYVQVDPHKITYNVGKDPEAATARLFDIMRKVPLISTDHMNHITVNGISNFVVLVDGKKDVSFTRGTPLSNILQAYPAHTVRSIEVITVPQPMYRNDGIEIVLNITTKRNRVTGYTVSVDGNTDTWGGYVGNINVISKIDKLSANLSVATQSRVDWTPESITERTNTDNDREHKLFTENSGKKTSYSHRGKFGIGYEIDSLRLLSIEFDAWNRRLSGNMLSIAEVQDAAGETVSRYRFDNILRNLPKTEYTVEANYQRSFKKEDRLLTFSYYFEKIPEKSRNINLSYEELNGMQEGDQTLNYVKSAENTGQIDYFDILNDGHEIGGGLKYIHRFYISNSEGERFSPTTGQWSYDSDYLQDDLSYTQQVASTYGSYNYQYKLLRVGAGFKFDFSRSDARQQTGTNTDTKFSNDFFNLMPNVSLSLSLGGGQNMSLIYNRKISRPDISYLNPYRDDRVPFQLTYGNPHLTPEMTDSYSLNWGIYKKIFSATLGLNASVTHDAIFAYSFIGETGMLELTYGNIGRRERYAASVSSQFTPNQKITLGLRGMAIYDLLGINGDGKRNNEGWVGSAGCDLRIVPWSGSYLLANVNYTSAIIGLEGKSTMAPRYAFVFSQSFMKHRLRFMVLAENIFHKYSATRQDIKTPTHHSYIDYKSRQQKITFSAFFRFGQMRASIPSADRTINNDDVTKRED